MSTRTRAEWRPSLALAGVALFAASGIALAGPGNGGHSGAAGGPQAGGGAHAGGPPAGGSVHGAVGVPPGRLTGGSGYRGGRSGYGTWRGNYGGYGGYGGYGWGQYGWGGVGLGWYAPLLFGYDPFGWGGAPYYFPNYGNYNWDRPVGDSQRAISPADLVKDPTLSTQPIVGSTEPSELIAYPNAGQSIAQQAKDRSECSRWAAEQTGTAVGWTSPTTDIGRRAAYLRAEAACLTGRNYTAR